MRLDFFLVADAASALQGKLFIHGGGITRITPPAFPWSQPLAFCVRLLVADDDDLSVVHKISIGMRDSEGTSVLAASDITLPPLDESVWLEGEERAIGLALTVSSIVFAEPGLFELELTLDDVVARTLPLRAILGETQPVLPPPA